MKLGYGLKRLALALSLSLATLGSAQAAPLQVGFSDWPGFVAWQIAIEKNWFKEAGIDVNFQWFDYSASLDAYAAGKLDAIAATNGDVLVTGSSGRKSIIVMANDYSDGNDMIIAVPGISSLSELKGKKIAVETGLVDHLMLLTALKQVGLSEKDVTLVNTKTNETPQVLASGSVAAIAAWQPSSGQALREVPGSRPLFTSREAPGLIYDVLAVSPESLKEHREEWKRLISVWDRVVAYIRDPKTRDDAVAIMSARVGLPPASYTKLLKGTHLLTIEGNREIYKRTEGLSSLLGSTRNADAFNIRYDVYKTPQNVPSYLDASLIQP
ncbi:ABC transporter substrate-binding protein [Acetobacter sp.]|uniref:ABC transporter substrate-binding protein n=1 Tax=Acetobacter sp. TaxID=440 RepID=UPI0025C593C0|nr:ABC transporter substrate-binding protein [Acetobacter sp.]MCH4090889.1 ABC transporter substrate-binding protein [Acetobacter sp.]MCI1301027.1 ABC transporter substrate-binding protein [Acetobacter sp.]MCI1317351.1 ABC transporter substrate-binding protein [Acetobacter sp.]